MFLLREALVPELRRSPGEKGAVSGEEARPPEKSWYSEELEEEVEDVAMLELGLCRWMVFSRRASTRSKLRLS